MVLNTLVYLAVVIIVIILIVVLLRFLFGVLFLAPIVSYAQVDEAGKTTIKTNDTDIHITCTENIEGLVVKCG